MFGAETHLGLVLRLTLLSRHVLLLPFLLRVPYGVLFGSPMGVTVSSACAPGHRHPSVYEFDKAGSEPRSDCSDAPSCRGIT